MNTQLTPKLTQSKSLPLRTHRKRACPHASTRDQPTLHHQLREELLSGTFIAKCKAGFPRVPWGPKELLKVLVSTASAAALAQSAIIYLPTADLPLSLSRSQDTQEAVVPQTLSSQSSNFSISLTAPQPSSSNEDRSSNEDNRSSAAAQSSRESNNTNEQRATATRHLNDKDNTDSTNEQRTAAARHFLTEAALLAASSVVLWFALRRCEPRAAGMFNYTLSKDWTLVTLTTCCVLFPIVDPLVSKAWAAVLGSLSTNASGGVFVDQLLSCRQTGDASSLMLHGLASAALGPIWEETFWRGFFLASLTRVLPLPVCVAISSTGFALLHLTPVNLLPILLLAPLGDLLFLRSASLGPPILLHAAWNGYQIIAIAVWGKDYFV